MFAAEYKKAGGGLRRALTKEVYVYTCLHLTKNYGEAKILFLRSVGRCSRTRPRGRSYGYRALLTTSSLMIPSRIMFLDVSISPAW